MKRIFKPYISKRHQLAVSIRRNWGLYLLLLPALTLTICFAYIPMYGILIAFKDFKPSLGITGSLWADPWFKYFLKFFKSFQFSTTIRNTLLINLYSLVVGFPLPIFLALMINQMRAKRFKKIFQTITYMPHFISTVVMVGIILLFLSPSSGVIGNIYSLFDVNAPNLMANAAAFPSIYVWSDVWQHIGWDSIIYIAALSSVDPTLYEAATVDGANRWQKLLHIDLPMLIPTAAILLILRIGNLMSIGFEKVYLMQNDMNLSTSEVIATYVYKIGIISAQYSYSAAINMFNTIVNFILLITVNLVLKRVCKQSLW
jgi:putative aldouronate transport system permease protein